MRKKSLVGTREIVAWNRKCSTSARVFAAESAQVLGQELDDGRDVGVDAHMASHAVRVLRKLGLHLLQAEEHGAGMVQQALPGRREVDAAGMPVQQRCLQRRLQVREALAHGGGGNVFPLGRASDGSQLAHGHEELQRGQVDPAGEGAGVAGDRGGDAAPPDADG